MEMIKVEEAVGSVLCHDITKIVPGEYKGRAFKKGHVITESDVPDLLRLGKEHIYVWLPEEGLLHENEAGIRLAKAVAAPGLFLTEPKEGKVNLVAEEDGICVIEEEPLVQINTIEDMIVATRSNYRPVKKGDTIASVRVVPLMLAEEKIRQAEAIGGKKPVITVKPFKPRMTGIVTTGSEVYHGRIEDKFGPVVKQKVEHYGCEVIRQCIVSDEAEAITRSIHQLIAEGAELILTTGGMSVDPDDVTPLGIRNSGARIVTYGAPVLPGAMLMVAYLGNVPILGLPGCVMYSKTTVFDLVLPLVLANETITRSMIVKWGLGGLCLKCETCHYPVCSFGTGA